MKPKRIETAQTVARAAAKADQAREGARAMQEYVERRAQAVAKQARLRALRIAHEHAVDQQKTADEPVGASDRPAGHDRIRASGN